ncbi:MAG: Tryptophan synthase alpha chain [Labilithrix sp.]|nr:Tryptophan synthase alpha chain [Labilithrix sp.]
MLTASATALASGCAETPIDLGTRPDTVDAAPPSTFTPVDPDSGAGGDASVDAQSFQPLELCTATECPSPYATCPGFSGGLAFKCETNLMTDDANCGECGNVCPTGFGSLGMTTHCVAGKCQRECEPDGTMFFADCNGWVDDGCEVHISNDAENCGACGVKCAPGVRCFDGKCGCPAGQVDCDGICVDTASSDTNCGTCGNRCVASGTTPPTNMEYGCGGGDCGQLRCKSNYSQQWRNCNDDIETDGCETNVVGNVNHCGQCGNKCAPGQQCLRDRNGIPFCACEPNETMCGSGSNLYCADLTNSAGDCGACGHSCPGSIANGQAVCRKGYCAYECETGWGDCDDDPVNGCETNLMVNGGNCGACGNRCDVAAGQPCVEGKCLTKPCDEELPK